MQNSNIIKLLGLKDVKIKNMQIKEEEVIDLKEVMIDGKILCKNCAIRKVV